MRPPSTRRYATDCHRTADLRGALAPMPYPRSGCPAAQSPHPDPRGFAATATSWTGCHVRPMDVSEMELTAIRRVPRVDVREDSPAGQKHSPHSPHSPRQDDEPGNEGNVGKDIPVNDVVSSNCKRIPPEPRSPVAKWPTECSGRPERPHSRRRWSLDTVGGARGRIVKPTGEHSERVGAMRRPIVQRVPAPILQFIVILTTVLT
jgi:hypothetical protein